MADPGLVVAQLRSLSMKKCVLDDASLVAGNGGGDGAAAQEGDGLDEGSGGEVVILLRAAV